MSTERTIAEAAKQVLGEMGRAASIHEIYEAICQQKLYVFDTPDPEHVLRTTS